MARRLLHCSVALASLGLPCAGLTTLDGGIDAFAAADGDDGRRLQARPEPERRFLVWLSDVHMDPFYGVAGQYNNNSAAVCSRLKELSKEEADAHPYGVLPCDPPHLLWRSALQAARAVPGGAELAIFTGDFVRHKPSAFPDPWNNTTHAIRLVSDSMAETFGGLAPERFVVGALGNDDSTANYHLAIEPEGKTSPWLSHVASILRGGGSMPAERSERFGAGGFFEAQLGDAEQVRILSLNTLIYSTKHKPADPKPKDPFGQFAWLRERLADAARSKVGVWIVGHIPPGLETFGYTPLWRKPYVESYLAIIQNPTLGAVIRAQLFGHVHADEFRVLPEAPPTAGPMLLTGAVSPVFESNPSFRLLEYDRVTGNLLNVKVFWADLTANLTAGQGLAWKFGYDFLGAYPSLSAAIQKDGGLTNQAFMSLRSDLRSSWAASGEQWQTYTAWYKTQRASDLSCASRHQRSGLSDETKWRFTEMYLCALTVGTHKDFVDCAYNYSKRAIVEQEPLDEDTLHPKLGVEAFSGAREHHWGSVASSRERGALAKDCGHVLHAVATG